MSLFPASRQITTAAAVRDLRSGSPHARALAAHALGDVGEHDRDLARAALIAALDDSRGEIRSEACASLGALEPGPGDPSDTDVTTALIARLADGLPEVRQSAAIALGSLGHADGFSALVDALRDGSADLRFQAASSLCEIDPIAAFVPLVAALGDGDAQVVGAVALALGATGDGRAAGHLGRLLEHADLGVRFDAAYGLAQLGDRRGRTTLWHALTDRDRAWDAIAALELLGDVDAVTALERCRIASTTSPEVAVRAAAAIIALSPLHPGAQAFLCAALAHRKFPVRGLAVEQLERIGGPWAIPAITAFAASRRGRELAAGAADAITAITARGAAP